MAEPRIKLQYLGDGIYRGADEFLSESLTVEPGDKVAVSERKAAILTKGDGAKLWKRLESSEGDVPPGAGSGASGGGALSTQNTPVK